MKSVISCPGCQNSLNVPDTMIGKKVKCPSCGTIFVAPGSGGSPSRPAAEDNDPFTEDPVPRKSGAGSAARSNPLQNDDEDDERPSRRSPRDEDDEDEDEDDRPRRRRRRRSSGGGGDAGGSPLPLIMGIMSICFGVLGGCILPIIFGPIGLVLGIVAVCLPSPPGSNAGRICGIIGMVISVGCGVLGALIGMMFIMGAQGGQFGP